MLNLKFIFILHQSTTLNGESQEGLKLHLYQGDRGYTSSFTTISGNAMQSYWMQAAVPSASLRGACHLVAIRFN